MTGTGSGYCFDASPGVYDNGISQRAHENNNL
jgi:hypothetical protein